MKKRRTDSTPLTQPQLPPLDPRQRYTVEESRRYLRESRAKFYARIKSGQIKTILDGGRRYTPGSEIMRLSTVE